MELLVQLGFQYGIGFVVLLGAYFIGSNIERNHYRILRRREEASMHFATTNFQALPPAWQVSESELVTGSVVISIDYFKRFLAGLRGLIGGRIRAYETLLDRGRREAIMRLKETARDAGYTAVINVRLETARLAGTGRDGQGTAGVEVLAFGTAIKLIR
jgi:uncharacterized protein YbjQ (UPF0145 family)